MRAEQPGEEQTPEEVETSNDAPAAAEPGGEPADLAGGVTESERPEAPLGAVAQEHGRLFERLQRVTAELENYRKRVDREREQWRQYALENFLKDLLATIDSLERAIQAARQSGDLEGLLAGLELIDRELHQTLERHGVQPIEALGQTFDPFAHEAVETEPAGEQAPGTVTAVLQRGYRLHDRVLRPSGVRVAQGGEPESRGSGTSGGEASAAEEGAVSRGAAELDIT